jgi:hypothetical protein
MIPAWFEGVMLSTAALLSFISYWASWCDSPFLMGNENKNISWLHKRYLDFFLQYL